MAVYKNLGLVRKETSQNICKLLFLNALAQQPNIFIELSIIEISHFIRLMSLDRPPIK
jgi:hypothetical protein